jgi:hypothetical protein
MFMNLFKIADELYSHLTNAGIKFTEDGYPIIPDEMILKDFPDEIVPFEHRNVCVDKQTTVLSHFSNDELLYRRLRNLEKDISICREYMGVVGFDLSPRLGWNLEQQKFNLLINQLVNTYRAVNGIKILPNFRIGELSTISALNSYPSNCLFAVGTLGCSKGYKSINSTILRTKLLYKRPSGLLVYGKFHPEYQNILDEFGIPYKVYQDFKATCYSRKKVS